MTSEQFVAQIRATLEPHRNPEYAVSMAAYMKNQFVFFGLKRPDWEPLVLLSLRTAPEDETWLHDTARLLWSQQEREFVYIAAQLLKKNKATLTPTTLALLEELIPQNAWWDSVDSLVQSVLVWLPLRFPELRGEMDRWSREENLWLRRAAILHQLGHRQQTDTERLFRYCRENATEKDFFIRKAIGWALRNYAATNPTAVREFVKANQNRFSPLSVREALKHLQ